MAQGNTNPLSQKKSSSGTYNFNFYNNGNGSSTKKKVVERTVKAENKRNVYEKKESSSNFSMKKLFSPIDDTKIPYQVMVGIGMGELNFDKLDLGHYSEHHSYGDSSPSIDIGLKVYKDFWVEGSYMKQNVRNYPYYIPWEYWKSPRSYESTIKSYTLKAKYNIHLFSKLHLQPYVGLQIIKGASTIENDIGGDADFRKFASNAMGAINTERLVAGVSLTQIFYDHWFVRGDYSLGGKGISLGAYF